MGEPADRRETLERIARELRESGIDGATFGRRILALLPHLPEEADGDVWRGARDVQSMGLSNEDLVELVLAIGRAGGGECRDE